jgi:hypothetical protein
MAVEIKEVIIRAVISQDNTWSGKEKQDGDNPEINKEALVNACVHEVMRILKRAKER